MCDIYMPEDVGKLFENQHVLILGGSFMRGVYKDLVWLVNHPSLIPREVLGAKCESSFPDLENTVWKAGSVDGSVTKIFTENNRDVLLETKGLTSGRTYIEPRRYYNKKYNVTFFYLFIVRAYSKELEEFLLEYEDKYNAPLNTIIMNSCLWDFNRWGPFGPDEYKTNMKKLMELIPKVLTDDGEFIWITCPMGAPELNSKGMNVPGLEFQCFTSRYNVIEGNFVAAQAVSSAGYGVVDIHYALQMQTYRRNPDGIHWDSGANRLVSNLVLTHISLARHGEEGLPGRITDDFALKLVKLKAKVAKEGAVCQEEVEDKLTELQNLPILQTDEEDKVGFQECRINVKSKLQELMHHEASRSRKNEYKGNLPQYSTKENRFHPYSRPGVPVWDKPAANGNMGMGGMGMNGMGMGITGMNGMGMPIGMNMGGLGIGMGGGGFNMGMGTNNMGMNIRMGIESEIEVPRFNGNAIDNYGVGRRREDPNINSQESCFSDDTPINYLNFESDPSGNNTGNTSGTPWFQDNRSRPTFNPTAPFLDQNQDQENSRYSGDTESLTPPSEQQLRLQEIDIKVREKVLRYTRDNGERPPDQMVNTWTRQIQESVMNPVGNMMQHGGMHMQGMHEMQGMQCMQGIQSMQGMQGMQAFEDPFQSLGNMMNPMMNHLGVGSYMDGLSVFNSMNQGNYALDHYQGAINRFGRGGRR